MWYNDLMNPLLIKVKTEDKENGRIFLNELFELIKRVDKRPEIGFFIGLIEKSYLKFGSEKDDSISLVDFSKHILGLAILYIKSNNDVSIWNSDFTLYLGKINPFMGGTPSTQKSVNKIEFDTFATLNHNVDINLDHFSLILERYTINSAQECENNIKLLYGFIKSCDKLDSDGSTDFNALLEKSKTQLLAIVDAYEMLDTVPSTKFNTLLQKIKIKFPVMQSIPDVATPAPAELDLKAEIIEGADENLQLPTLTDSPLHRLSIFKKITSAKLDEQYQYTANQSILS